ncbi:transposase domain-containing protein, partial [Streptomyces sp. NPDC057271]|uniref:transposase domain-containing protein n=1 Tax=unclassified Streptomyces TaxID=2593676 RepID=UPI00363BE706
MDQDALRERKLQNLVSVGVLAADVPRDVIDEVVAEHGRQARRSDGKLPPHVVVYMVMGLALFRGEDYESAERELLSVSWLRLGKDRWSRAGDAPQEP